MKIIKGIFYFCLMFVVAIGSICAPNIMFNIIDNNNLGHKTEIRVEDSNVLTIQAATLREKLELFGSGYETIKASISAEEQEMISKKVNKKISSFFAMYGFGDLISESDNISVEKYVYWRKEGNVYSFPAYKVQVKGSLVSLDFVMDTEGLVILHLEMSLNEKPYEKEDMLYMLFCELIYKYDDGMRMMGVEEGVKLLAGYYDFGVDDVSGKIVDYSDGTYGNEAYDIYTSVENYADIDKIVSKTGAYVYTYYLYDNVGEFIEYNVELSDNKIIFNS